MKQHCGFCLYFGKETLRGKYHEAEAPPMSTALNAFSKNRLFIWGLQCVHYSRDAWMQWHSPCSVGLHSLSGEESA